MKFLPQIIITILFQLQITNASLNFAYTIYNTSTQIVSISQGLAHITIVSTPVSSPATTNIELFNIETNVSYMLHSTTTLKIYLISERLGLNTYLNNSYLISYTTPLNDTKCSQIYLNNFTQTFGNIWYPTTLFQIYGIKTNSAYQLYLNTIDQTLSFQGIYNNSIQQYLTYPNGFIYSYGITQQNNKLYVLISNQIYIGICLYYFNDIIDFMITQTSLFQSISQNHTNALIKVDNNYFVICYAMKIIVYLNSNYSINCMITLNQTVYDMRVSNGSIYVTTANIFYQYDALLCNLLDTYYTGAPYRINLHIKLDVSPNQRVFLWKNDTPSPILIFNADGNVKTAPNISDTTNITNTNNTTTNITNSTINATNITNTTITNITNNNNTINIINETTNVTNINNNQINTTNSTINNNSINQTNSSGIYQNLIEQIQLCHESKQGVCAVYCNYKCSICSINDPYQKCVQCGNNYDELTPGICSLSSNTVFSVSVTSFVNSFRFISAQSFYYIIDNIEFYQHHRTQYKGITKIIFQQVNFFQNNEWGFFPSVINDWIQKPFDTFPYIAFTNQKFVSVQHTSSLIFQTMKGFYIIQIPFLFILFLFFKFLFYRLSRYQISSVLRIYSFWTQFFVILFISNPLQIAYNSILHFQLLFSISSNFKLLHIVCISLIGFIFIFIISFFFLNEYFHQNLSKYFLVNTYRIKYAISYNFFRFSIFPYIQSAVHIYLNNNGSHQLLILGFLPLITSIILIMFESNFSLFKSKTIFMLDSVSQISVALYNFSLWLQHYFLQHEIEILQQILQKCLSLLSYIITYTAILSIIFPFLLTILFLILCKNKNRFQQMVTKGNIDTTKKQKLKLKSSKFQNFITSHFKIHSSKTINKFNKNRLIFNFNIQRNKQLQQTEITQDKNQIIIVRFSQHPKN